MQKQELFGEHWKNSIGQKDGWSFVLQNGDVVLKYHVLFDANELDYDDFSATFSQAQFRALLEGVLNNSEAHIENEREESLRITRRENGEFLFEASKRVSSRETVGVTFICLGIPKAVFTRFGLVS